MSWTLRYSDDADRQLAKLDTVPRRRIITWMRDNVSGCDDPKAHGKALQGKLAGYWRYRVGAYRVICQLDDGELTVLAVKLGHRSKVYR